jgi:hypothetical protein
MGRDYRYNGFDADAAYFDLIASQTSDRNDRKELRRVADAYRALAKYEVAGGNRQEHWMQRADRCRQFASQFTADVCRQRLLRLAETYDILAGEDVLAPSQWAASAYDALDVATAPAEGRPKRPSG